MKNHLVQKVGVLGLAVNANHQFLLTKRNEPTIPELHQKWQVPGGGVEANEQPIDTFYREMNEELLIKPEIIFPYPIVKTKLVELKNATYQLTLMTYICVIGSQKPKIGDPETLDYAWFKREDLYGIEMLQNTQEFCDETTKICNQYSLWPR